jgi:sporulation protein YlmC with PRC-barrel domain
MSETQIIIGADVRCTDGACGHLQRIVIDPIDNKLTHLAVEPGHGVQVGRRLVPVDQVATVDTDTESDSATNSDSGIRLRSSLAEFERFESAEEASPEHRASWPYSPPDLGGRFPAGLEGVERDTGYGNRTTTRDRIPDGGVEVRRAEPVYAVDGEVGRVQGLTVDLQDGHVMHLLVDKGRLKGRTRLAVPIESVMSFGDGIRLDLTKDQVFVL